MTRNQRLALAGSLTLLVVLGLVAAYLLGSSSGSSTTGSSPGGSGSVPSGGSSGPPSTQPLPPLKVATIKLSSRPSANGGWGSDVALTFAPQGLAGTAQPQLTIAQGNGVGEYDVTFDRAVTIPASALAAVQADAARLLMRLTWDPSTHQLQITQSAFVSNITKTVATSVSGVATVEFVRTPQPPTTNGCIQVTKPVPYTALFGISKATGFADLFEAGPMFLVARVPGKGQHTTKVRTASAGRQPFSADLELPLLDAPAEGYVAAYEPSAKDGSPTCLVKIPVYLSPGG